MSFQIPKNYNLIIGSHVSLKANDYFLGSVKETLEYNANALMIYTGAPQNTKRIEIEKLNIDEGVSLLKEKNIDLKNVIVHAPYIINLCSSKPLTRKLARDCLLDEIKRTQSIGAKYLVLHPGSHLEQTVEVGLDLVVQGLNSVLNSIETDVVICLETMAGKGSEVNKNLEQLEYLVKNIDKQNNIGVCIDTCHINDAGYSINEINGYLDELNKRIGIDKVKVIHLNDSKNPLGSHKDRHENIGYGHIGFEALLKVVYHPLLNNIPKILETPYFSFVIEKEQNGKVIDKEISMPIYKQEIEMLRNGKWFDIKKDILEHNKIKI